MESGLVAQAEQLRTTRWHAVSSITPPTAVGATEAVLRSDHFAAEPMVEPYGMLEVARDWGRRIGRFTPQAFEVLEHGTLRCPGEKMLRPPGTPHRGGWALRIVERQESGLPQLPTG